MASERLIRDGDLTAAEQSRMTEVGGERKEGLARGEAGTEC